MKIHPALSAHVRQFSREDVLALLEVRKSYPYLDGKDVSLVWAIQAGKVQFEQLPKPTQDHLVEFGLYPLEPSSNV